MDCRGRCIHLSRGVKPRGVLGPTPVSQAVGTLRRFGRLYVTLRGIQIVTITATTIHRTTGRARFLGQIGTRANFDFGMVSNRQRTCLSCINIAEALPVGGKLVVSANNTDVRLVCISSKRTRRVVDLPVNTILLSRRCRLSSRVGSTSLFSTVIEISRTLKPRR